jgi:uncharacterized protein YdiU (UPF0061 family)
MELANQYAQLPERMHADAQPATVPAPVLFGWNQALARQLGLGELGDEAARAQMFSGNRPLPGARPIAAAYAGHQFGQFSPQLGDGRALLLGEAVGADGRHYDIQLKGSGRTPFSRGGDGKSSLGPVVREYILSEAMHALGVPTTRALAAVATGEKVIRNGVEPGGVFTRVASSHLRVGSFQYFAARGDVEALRALADFAIGRHDPAAAQASQPYLALFTGVVERQAALVAHWMDIGFIHGVMNTDNFTISGETLDYGPCAFMDEYHADKVFSSIDHGGRYAYRNQATIAHWNLARLAECLLVLDEDLDAFQAQLDRLPGLFEKHYHARMRRKLGLAQAHDGDVALIGEWLDHLQTNELDYTLAHRRLATRAGAQGAPVFGDFERRWQQRLRSEQAEAEATRALMNAVNPLYIPRNHQVELAIQAAFKGDFEPFHALRKVLEQPFTEQPGCEAYTLAPRPEQRVTRTFCGT